MLKKTIAFLLLSTIATGASAHEVWLEREGSNVRAFVGDATGDRDKGEDIVKLVATSKLFIGDPPHTVPVTAQPDHLAATVVTPGDLRYYNDQVWAPWKDDAGVLVAAAFQAKAGRSETRAIQDYELVPVAPGSDSFTLQFKGKPLADKDVVVITPDFWEKTFHTDAAGQITVPVSEKGRYILVARHEASADVEIAGQKVAKLQHVASLSFIAE